MKPASLHFASATIRELSDRSVRRSLEQTLCESIVRYRWFGGKARPVQAVSLIEVVPLSAEDCLALVQVDYLEGEPEEYLMPLSLAVGPAAERLLAGDPARYIAQVQLADSDAVAALYDSMTDERAAGLLLDLIRDERELTGDYGSVVGRRTSRFAELHGTADSPPKAKILNSEQSNTSVLYGDRLILKLFRRPERGINPDVEVTTFLTEKVGFQHVPPMAGTIEYRRVGEPVRSLAVVQGFVPNQGVAWEYTLDQLGGFYVGQLIGARSAPPAELVAPGSLVELADRPLPEAARPCFGSFLPDAELLGRRTAELHLALASSTTDEEFQPEPYTPSFQESAWEAARNLTERTFNLLKQQLSQLAPKVQKQAQRLLDLEAAVLARFRSLTEGSITGQRIRVHGDYHLGQVLYTGQDFVIIDFEGEPIRALAERRIKMSPLRDVAGMLRSFDYAAYSALADFNTPDANAVARGEDGDLALLQQWGRTWKTWTSVAFLRSYLQTVDGANLLPESREEVQMLLNVLLLEKAVYELQYELNNRPDWVPIPLRAVLDLAR